MGSVSLESKAMCNRQVPLYVADRKKINVTRRWASCRQRKRRIARSRRTDFHSRREMFRMSETAPPSQRHVYVGGEHGTLKA
jgi:hypothetical protein